MDNFVGKDAGEIDRGSFNKWIYKRKEDFIWALKGIKLKKKNNWGHHLHVNIYLSNLQLKLWSGGGINRWYDLAFYY